MTNIAQKIQKSLVESFVFTNEIARILSLGFVGKRNIIVFGPGGHGKSAMVQKVIEDLGMAEETFFQFFGEGMDESRLFGGLNFKKLEEEKVLEYYPEKSFLNSRVAVFEELFDAPASVLLALKDVLTAKELRNGSQRFKMKTEVIICLTNKEPSEISDLGPATHALIERFPLQLNLKWKDYSAKSYLQMFEKVAHQFDGPVLNGFKAVLAEILAKATEEGNFVSPRTAVHAFQVCQTAAQIRGATQVEKQDLTDLRFLPGLEGLAETIQKDLNVAMERAEAEAKLVEAEEKLRRLTGELREASAPIKALQVAKKLMAFQDETAKLKVTDGLKDRRKAIRDSVGEKIAEAQARALENTRI
ncbi:MAG: AAA family ATPase [Candidatus Moranbacteria bacterium]|nr:AAA family ATPase [Candidatus Moranbacteria bacterium]